MYKVLVVDDETLIRKRIIFGFDWESWGYQVVSEAGNGPDALEILEREAIDVAIVDIAMPDMNGIELVREIRRRNYPVEVIFLTGHSNFEYAKEAMAEGVYYYILKPLDEAEFSATLRKLANKMDKEQERERTMLNLKESRDHINLFLKCKFFSDLFHARISLEEDELKEKLEQQGVRLHNGYRVVVIKIEKDQDSELNIKQELDRMLQFLTQKMPGLQNIITLYDVLDDCIILFIDISENPSLMQPQRCIELFKPVCSHMEGTEYACVRAGISREVKSTEIVSGGYEEALTALQNTMMHEEKVLEYGMLLPFLEKKFRISSAQKGELRREVESGGLEETARKLKKIFSDIGEEKIGYSEFSQTVKQIFYLLSEIAFESNLDIKGCMDGYSSLETALSGIKGINGMYAWLYGIAEKIIASREFFRKRGQNIELVHKVKQYIMDNYRNQELTLTDISEYLHVTPPYLSGSFKKAVGMSVTQYVSMIRLEKAKEILCSRGMDVRSTAEQVGYSDEYYFSRCFKKYFGVSPSSVIRINNFD